jgi:hypothetical protein
MDMTTPMQPKPLVNATCKLGEKGCFKDGRCHALGGCENKIVTNADRIRAMTDEELATFLETFGCCHYCSEHHRLGGARFYSDEKCDEHCQDHLLDWLKQPAEKE